MADSFTAGEMLEEGFAKGSRLADEFVDLPMCCLMLLGAVAHKLADGAELEGAKLGIT